MTHNCADQEEHAYGEAADPRRGRLLFAVALTAVVLAVEVGGGLWSHSIALLSDAAHVFTDLVSLALSLGAIMIAARPVTKEHTFGFHRAEIFAAFVNGLALLAISAYLLFEAYQRLRHPPAVRVVDMLGIAVAGLLANGVIAFRLRTHAHDLNVRSAYLHVLADLGGSVGVVVAAAIMLPTGWYIADPIVAAGISVLVLLGSLRLLRETIHILLEGVPRRISLEDVAAKIRAVPGVDDIHDLHIWTVCSDLLALSVHVTVGDRPAEERDRIVRRINDELLATFGIAESTIQTEREPCRTSELIHVVCHQPHRPDSDHRTPT